MRTILIVEDEPTVLLLAEGFIAALGHATQTAHNGSEALALLQDDNVIDLLFTDLDLGVDPDGLALAKAAVEQRPHLQVLYTSGQSVTDGLQALMVEGSAFLPKPYTPQDLEAAIVSLLPTAN